MSDIPSEVITIILYPLPVKSLLRFRCVCKSWKSLIDSPNFIQAHLKRQQLLQPNSDSKLILAGLGNTLFSLDFPLMRRNSTQQLDDPLKPSYGPTPSKVQVLGSCNGLLLLSNNESAVLWNPSTKMSREFPNYDFETLSPWGFIGFNFRAGFGYDCSTDDYKVVRIAQWLPLDDSSLVSVTVIYSLKLNMWKKASKSCPYWLEGNANFVGGVLHWFASKQLDDSLILISLNLGTETFQEVPYPENLGVKLSLSVLGECLCLISGHETINRRNAKYDALDHVDVWVMKDYGVKESWIKLFSIKQLVGRHCFSYVRPVAYSVSRREVLLEMDHRKFMWYNLGKKSLKPFKISGGLDCFESSLCLASLVPVNKNGNGKDMKKNIEPDEDTEAKECEKGDEFRVKGFKLKF